MVYRAGQDQGGPSAMNESDQDPAKRSQQEVRDALARAREDRQRMLRETRAELGDLLRRPKPAEPGEQRAEDSPDEGGEAPAEAGAEQQGGDESQVSPPAPPGKTFKAMKPMDSSAPTRPIKTGAIIAALVVAAVIVIAAIL